MSKNLQYHERTKHIDVKLYVIREVIAKRKVTVSKVQTKENAADMLTKIVTNAKLEHCLQLLKVIDYLKE